MGSWLAFLHPAKPPAQPVGISKTSNRIITVLVVLLVIAAPLCYRWLVAFTSDSGGANYLRAVYVVLSDEASQKDSRVSLLLNILTLGNTVALLAFFVHDGNKNKRVMALLTAFALKFMSLAHASFT